ncbi:MAG: type II secretion system protein GspG [Planctomycetaceae bacterium]|nr:type II secretion system protein GspG [Planctomycetaceae bacterium]
MLKIHPPLLLVLTLLVTAGWAENKILYLTNGDTLEGEIVDETQERLSLRLKSGVTISLNQDEIESIETAKSIAEMEQPSIEEPVAPPPDLNLNEVFRSANPTPTPIPISRLGSLKIRKKFKAKEFRESLLPKNLGQEENQPMRNLPQIPEQDEEGNRNSGVVTYLETGPKIRSGPGGWSPLEADRLLNPGDEINTLEGRIEITTQPGNLLRLEPNTQVLFERSRSLLKKGKAWLVTFDKNPSTIEFGNVVLKLQPDGLIHIETLRSGHKISILEGTIRVHNQPQTPRLLKSIKGPSSVWIDGANALSSDSEIESVLGSRWEDWQKRIAQYASQHTTGLEDFVTEAEDKDQSTARALILELAEAVSEYYMDHGSFPPDIDPPLMVLVQNPGDPKWKGPYLEGAAATLKDPWGGNFVYRPMKQGEDTIAGIYIKGSNQRFEEGEGDDIGILVPPPDTADN